MANPSVVIDIAAEYTGKKAFDKAGKSTSNLEKNVKSLGRTLGLAFSTAAVLSYGKASVKAAAADMKAQQQLALALKNVGLGRDAATAEGYIQRIEKEFGIIDDKLRPAYSRLAIATRDSAETERLMGIAMDISASTGKDLDSVTSALSKAYLGSNTSLGKLGVGITKADLKTKSFKEISEQLAATFAGAGKKSADSFAGTIDKLAIASNNAKETIGKGLIDALNVLGENNGVNNLNAALEETSLYIADVIRGIGALGDKLKGIPLLGKGLELPLDAYVQAIPVIGAYISILSNMGKELRLLNTTAKRMFAGGSGTTSRDFIKEKEAKALLAAEKKRLDLQKKNAAASKLAAANAAKLAKAESIFNLEKIQIEAALKGKISEEDKTRLLLMRAILEEDASTAEKLEKKLADIQKKNAEIAADLAIIAATKDPFATWAGSLSLALIELGKYGKGLADVPNLVPGVNFNPTQNADRNYDQKVAAVTAAIEVLATPPVIPSTNNIPAIGKTTLDLPTPVMPTTNMPTPTGGGFGYSLPSYITSGANFAGGAYTPPAPITIIVEGSVLDGDDFSEIVNKATLNAYRRGLSQLPAGALP
jgi:hypothetical protein